MRAMERGRAAGAAGVAVLAAMTAACTGGAGGSTAASQPPTATSATTAAAPLGSLLQDRQPVDAGAPLPGPGQGRVRVLQRARRAGPRSRVALLPVPGFGTLSVTCGGVPTTRFVLTAWAKGEGPPAVQHVAEALSHPVAPPPLNALHTPVFAAVTGTGPEAFDQWSVAIASEAFSGTATVWSAVLPVRGGCDEVGQALVVTHGPFWRYAPRHG